MSDEEDERFAHIKNDPRFRSIPKWERKIKIDKRFSSMFHDKRFKLHYSMDKRGRPLQQTSSEDLKKYYDIGSSESDQEASDEKVENGFPDDEKEKSDEDFAHGKGNVQSSDDGDESDEDLARGKGNVQSSSSDESSEDEDEQEKNGFDHKWGEIEKGVTRSENVSHRLAVCNMDWDRIKASDLFVLFTNFKPPQGIINSVKVYPSEFGIQRMKEEEVRGPAELTEMTLASDEEDLTETREGSKYHMETLRKYQLNRLKYYYAVVDCDTVETASALYSDLDGMEYESSASQFDLRFIPDDMVFEHEPKSSADKLPDMSTYQPVLFTTKALQQTMVELTWDENNPDRLRTLQKAFQSEPDNLNDDLRAYLASSSDSSEDEKQDQSDGNESSPEKVTQKVKQKDNNHASGRIARYKELLASLEEDEKKKKQKDIEMEITWEPGLKDRAENLIKNKQQKQDMTCFEQYLDKKKEAKKQRKKKEKEPKEDEGEENGRNEQDEEEEADLCEDDDIPSDVDLNDPFFKDEINNVKGTKSKKKMMQRNRKNKLQPEQDEKSKAELELLLMDEQTDSKKHFNLKHLVEDASLSKRKKKKMEKIRAKQVKAKDDDFQINTTDPRFNALFTSADYNIDPSDTHFKKTKAMETLLHEKQKRRTQRVSSETNIEEPPEKRKMMDPSLSFLVKSVKNKTQNFKRRRN